MANLTAPQRKYAVVAATLFLLIALGLGAMSMFYVGWIKYTVTTPASPSTQFTEGVKTRYIYNTRHRGLFFYTIDDPEAEIVKADGGNRYFPVVYNTNATGGVGFWTLTNIMKASVGLHVAYLAGIALVIWMVVFSLCLGKKLIYLGAGLLVLGLTSGAIGQVLFHIYVDMEKFSGIPTLPDLWYYWPEELKDSTTETLYLSFGVHIGSFGASVLALLTIALLSTSWGSEERVDEERAASDKVNIYTRDNLAYDDTLMDRPARAELWNGFDRLSEKRANSERRVRANYPRDDGYAETGHAHHHHHHQQSSGGFDDRIGMERAGAPTRQHYHTDPGNFPIRY